MSAVGYVRYFQPYLPNYNKKSSKSLLHHGKEIVIATNIAETYLKFDAITFVIDSGFSK